MQNVWDRYDYGRDTTWYRATGYPLMKAVAEYWIHEMVPDLYWNDGTLVAAPCNSPEHGWTVRQYGFSHIIICSLLTRVDLWLHTLPATRMGAV